MTAHNTIADVGNRLYFKRCETAWTSDDTGQFTWNLGFAVYENTIKDDDQGPLVVYEDDGRGNGDYVGDADSLELATAMVDRLVAQADARGF